MRWVISLAAALVVIGAATLALFAVSSQMILQSQDFFANVSYSGTVVVNEQLFARYNTMYLQADSLRVTATAGLFAFVAGGFGLLALVSQRWDTRKVPAQADATAAS